MSLSDGNHLFSLVLAQSSTISASGRGEGWQDGWQLMVCLEVSLLGLCLVCVIFLLLLLLFVFTSLSFLIYVFFFFFNFLLPYCFLSLYLFMGPHFRDYIKKSHLSCD